MSASFEERTDNWRKWIAANKRSGLVLAGFKHHCGGSTIVSDWDRWVDDFSVCGGCRFTLDGRDADTSATPLYGVASVDEKRDE